MVLNNFITKILPTLQHKTGCGNFKKNKKFENVSQMRTECNPYVTKVKTGT